MRALEALLQGTRSQAPEVTGCQVNMHIAHTLVMKDHGTHVEKEKRTFWKELIAYVPS
jgi:hypothetical protein